MKPANYYQWLQRLSDADLAAETAARMATRPLNAFSLADLCLAERKRRGQDACPACGHSIERGQPR